MNRFFTLIELIVVIVVLGILAVIVIPNISSMKDEAKGTAIASNIANIQTAVDTYTLEKGEAFTSNKGVQVGIPYLLNIDSEGWEELVPEYIRAKPRNGNYWINYDGTVYGANIGTSNNVNFRGGEVTWESPKGAIEHQVYYEEYSNTQSNASNNKLIPIGTQEDYILKDGVYTYNYEPNDINTNKFFVASKDKYGNWTPPVSGEEIQVKTIKLDEYPSIEQTHTFVIEDMKEVEKITSDTGKVEVVSIKGDEVTVKVSDGERYREVQTGGEYIPEDTKYIKDISDNKFISLTQSFRHFFSSTDNVGTFTFPYSKEDYLKLQSTRGPWTTSSASYSSVVYYYNKDGYQGTLESKTFGSPSDYFNRGGSIQKALDEINSLTYEQYNELINNVYESGRSELNSYKVNNTSYHDYGAKQIGIQLFETITINDFEGEVVRKEKDTRTYEDYYQYNITVSYK